MSAVLITLYLAGWIATTVVLMRKEFAVDSDERHRALLGVVGVLCAAALAAVWPLSAWLLPLLRGVIDDTD